VRGYQKSGLAFANDVATTGHVGGDQGTPTCRRFEQDARHTLAVVGGQADYVRTGNDVGHIPAESKPADHALLMPFAQLRLRQTSRIRAVGYSDHRELHG
jgi:hypothetical protein